MTSPVGIDTLRSQYQQMAQDPNHKASFLAHVESKKMQASEDVQSKTGYAAASLIQCAVAAIGLVGMILGATGHFGHTASAELMSAASPVAGLVVAGGIGLIKGHKVGKAEDKAVCKAVSEYWNQHFAPTEDKK